MSEVVAYVFRLSLRSSFGVHVCGVFDRDVTFVLLSPSAIYQRYW